MTINPAMENAMRKTATANVGARSLEQIKSDDNSQATPAMNAADIDVLVGEIQKLIELMGIYDQRLAAAEEILGLRAEPATAPGAPPAPGAAPAAPVPPAA
jgi:hypothetical protein